jgi:hypothetical protein
VTTDHFGSFHPRCCDETPQQNDKRLGSGDTHEGENARVMLGAIQQIYITFSNSFAYPNPTFKIFSPPTEYKAPNPPTPIMEAGISDILPSSVGESDVGARGGNKTTILGPEP